MLQNAAIDVAIGLILMYLMLSLLCTVVNEYIATKLKLRASTLQDALQKLIDDPTLLTNFYSHGLIASNFRASATGSQSTLQAVASVPSTVKNLVARLQAPAANAAAPGSANAAAPAPIKAADHPSYLAAGTVALAIMGSLLKRLQSQQPPPQQPPQQPQLQQQPQQQPPQQQPPQQQQPLQQAPQQSQQQQPPQQAAPVTTGFAAVEDAINKLDVAPKLKDALQASLLTANGDINALQTSIATWFDDSMDRLSGAYKRKMKWIAMLIGLLVAIAFNADSFKVATTLWNDPDRRASTIAIATDIAKNNIPSLEQGGGQKPPGDAAQPPAAKQPSNAAPPAGQKSPGDAKQSGPGKAIENTEHVLRSLPIGWSCPEPGPGKTFHYWTCAEDELSKLTLVQLLGWILTAAALSLGAPFWFDMLNKFINLRGAGGKPVREDQKT
jgi:hypothetical protein